MPLKPALRDPDGGLRFLEEKLSIYVQGANGQPGHRRNPALDLLTGRVPDHRVQTPVGLPQAPIQPTPPASHAPQTLVIPMAAVAVAPRPAALAVAAPAPRANPSPWLQPSTTAAAAVPRIRFDAGVQRGTATWRVARWLLAPLAAGLILAAGFGLARGLTQADDTVVVSSPGPTSQPAATAVPAREIEPPPAPPQQTVAPAAPVPSDQLSVLLDERFGSADNARGWTNDPSGVAWLADGAYHLFARQAAKFVAVSVPGTQDLSDVVVSGHFRKTAGPAGGGYGLIVRDQAPERMSGQSQDGPFYVFEVGDKGEVGVWLREDDHWVDLLPWTPSDAVHPGLEGNDLTVSAMGDRLSVLVNGVPVATQLDTLLHSGGVAIFTGGDGNQVAIDRLTVRTPR